MSGSWEDMTLVTLPPDRFARLLDFVTRPPGKHESGGFQKRRLRWLLTMNAADLTVLLNHAGRGRLLDDMTWIEHAIRDQQQGGFQHIVSRVFVNTHPRFTGIAVRPRKPRGRR